MDVKGGVHDLRELAEVGILCVHRPSSEDSLQKVREFCKSPRLVRENEITITLDIHLVVQHDGENKGEGGGNLAIWREEWICVGIIL